MIDLRLIAGRPLQVRVTRRRGARRLVLRLDPARQEARVSAPLRVSDRQIARFLDAHDGWMAERLAAAPAATPFAEGAAIPYGGVMRRIQHDPAIGRRVVVDADRLHVGGEAATLPQRIGTWLKAEARRDLGARARAHAATLARRVTRIRIGDPRTRWGSCSTTGALSFSWRLILSPDFVRDYVAAHEAAHLVEMNHSPAFWALVRDLTPHERAGNAWLKREGPGLRLYG